MNEKPRGETGSSPENAEDQKYATLQAALAEQERIQKEIGEVIDVPPAEREANETRLKELGGQADEASRNFGKALEEYLTAIDEAHEQEK